jgi:hypothetical protein
MPSAATLRTVMGHGLFAALVVFAVTALMLVMVNPPFVHEPSEKPRNALEAAPCSYGRVMVSAAVFALLAAAVPHAVRHRKRIAEAATSIQGWVSKLRSSTAQ